MIYRDKSFSESKKARAFVLVLLSMNTIIGVMLALGKSQEFLQLPFGVLGMSVVGYLGSQMAPDVASAWRSSSPDLPPPAEPPPAEAA